MNQDNNDKMAQKSAKPPIHNLNRYPLFHEAISIIFHNVLDGINQGKSVHMSLGQYSLINEGNMNKDLSLKGLANRLSLYKVIASDAATSSVCINLEHPNKKDIFEDGEFIYACKTGHFHFIFNGNGALSEIISELDGKTPQFISCLVKDFPGNNYLPDDKLLNEISNSDIIDNLDFVSGLYPWMPITIEVE